MEDTLALFVRESLLRGQSRDAIREALRAGGWPDDEIRKALDSFAEVPFAVPVPRRRPYLSAREAFLYLVLFLTLYVSAISLGLLAFELVERAFPDALDSAWANARSASTIRWSTACLLIAFPAYLLFARWSLRSLTADADKRQSRIRKWLTYLTLFVAAAAILVDLITLVFNVLEGELTTRFLLKVAAVGAIAGTTFGYYLWELRGDEHDELERKRADARRGHPRLLAALVSAVVLSLVVAGFVAAGSPQNARMKRLDAQRIEHLQQISSAIDSYWHRRDELPGALADLTTERNLYLQSIRDPESGSEYEYRALGATTYELCATFSAESDPNAALQPDRGGGEFWRHGAGRTCWPLEIEQHDAR
jgi:hypothetical protein